MKKWTEMCDKILSALGYKICGTNLEFTPGKEIILADVETTGLNSNKDEIIEISAIKCYYDADKKQLIEIEELDEFIKPTCEVPAKIEEITGITNSFLADKPSAEDAFPKISNFFGTSPIFIAYNSRFDKAFITNYFVKFGAPFKIEDNNELDALKMAKELVDKKDAPKQVNKSGKLAATYKLGKIAELYGVDTVEGFEDGSFHSSIFDVKVTKQLVNEFISEYLVMVKEQLEKPPISKSRAIVESIAYWAGYRGYSRLYVNCTLEGKPVSYFYDIRGKFWGEKDEGAIEKTYMDQFKDDVFALANVDNEDDFAKCVTNIEADESFLARYKFS